MKLLCWCWFMWLCSMNGQASCTYLLECTQDFLHQSGSLWHLVGNVSEHHLHCQARLVVAQLGVAPHLPHQLSGQVGGEGNGADVDHRGSVQLFDWTVRQREAGGQGYHTLWLQHLVVWHRQQIGVVRGHSTVTGDPKGSTLTTYVLSPWLKQVLGFCVLHMHPTVVLLIHTCWVMRRCVFCGVSCFLLEWILRGVATFMLEWVWRRVWAGMLGWVCCGVRTPVFEGLLWGVRFTRVVGPGVLSLGGPGRLIHRHWGGRRGWSVLLLDMKIYSTKIIK